MPRKKKKLSILEIMNIIDEHDKAIEEDGVLNIEDEDWESNYTDD